MSGKSNKQQIIDKSSITKVWSTTQCTHLLFLVKIMAELCLCLDLLNLNGLACENDCSVKWKIKQQCSVALHTAWLFNSKLFYIHIQSLFSLISFLCRSISCSHFSITFWHTFWNSQIQEKSYHPPSITSNGMVHAPFFNFSSIWLSSLKPIICLHSVRLLCMVSVFPFSVYRCSDQSHSLPVRAGEAQPATGSPGRFRVCKCVSLNHLCLHTNQGQIQLFWKPCTKLFFTSAVYEIFKHDKKGFELQLNLFLSMKIQCLFKY